MISLDTVLNAYIDANIILAIGAAIWAATQVVLRCTPLGRAFGGQLRLLYAVLTVVGVAPFAVLALWPVVMALIPGGVAQINLSDLIVAEYLDGRFAMAPTTFEALLSLRGTMVRNVTTLGSSGGVVIAVVLLLGIGLGVLRTARNLIRLHLMIGQSYLWRRSGRVDIRLTEKARIPFSTRGLWRFHVVIPSHMLANPGDLRIALAHEFQHLRQGDLPWELGLELLRPLFVFNPAMGFWKRQVETRRELACDQRVIRRKKLNAQSYAASLLRVCALALQDRSGSREIQPSVALLQIRGRRNERFLRQRVTAMMQSPVMTGSRHWVTALLIPLSLAIGLASVSIQRSGDWSQDRLMLSAIVNLERMDLRSRPH